MDPEVKLLKGMGVCHLPSLNISLLKFRSWTDHLEPFYLKNTVPTHPHGPNPSTLPLGLFWHVVWVAGTDWLYSRSGVRARGGLGGLWEYSVPPSGNSWCHPCSRCSRIPEKFLQFSFIFSFKSLTVDGLVVHTKTMHRSNVPGGTYWFSWSRYGPKY